jgi:hypothetical protein
LLLRSSATPRSSCTAAAHRRADPRGEQRREPGDVFDALAQRRQQDREALQLLGEPRMKGALARRSLRSSLAQASTRGALAASAFGGAASVRTTPARAPRNG